MKSSKRPFKQGQLDGMCGCYSVINSLHYLYNLDGKEAESILYKMIAKDNAFRGTYSHGMFVDKLLAFAKIGVKASKRKVKIERPYESFTFESNQEFFEDLNCYLQTGSVAIIAVQHPWYHWTVVTKVGRKYVQLFDSYFNFESVPVSQFTIFSNSKKKCIMYDDTVIFTPK